MFITLRVVNRAFYVIIARMYSLGYNYNEFLQTASKDSCLQFMEHI